MVIGQFLPLVGGAEKQALLLAQALGQRGVRVRIVTARLKWGWPRREHIRGVEVRRLFALWGAFGIRGLRKFGRYAFMLRLFAYLISHADEYDVIHAHQLLHPAFAAAAAGKVTGKPVAATVCCCGYLADPRVLCRDWGGARELAFMRRWLDRLVALCRTSVGECRAAGFRPERMTLIPTCTLLPAHPATVASSLRQMICTARLAHQKGIDILLHAFRRVSERRPELRLDILGDGPLRPELERQAQRIGVGHAVRFKGLVHDVPARLARADAFALASRAEIMSVALQEAMAHGLPCIVTRVGGTDELVQDGVNGLLVPPENPTAFADAIERLCGDVKLRRALGRNARRTIEREYTADLMAERHLALYRRMTEPRQAT